VIIDQSPSETNPSPATSAEPTVKTCRVCGGNIPPIQRKDRRGRPRTLCTDCQAGHSEGLRDLGRRTKAARKAVGLTAQQVADAVGVSTSVIYATECGVRAPRARVLEDIWTVIQRQAAS
jgi:DNA-binding XRE family transcriptional regulator